MSNEKGGFSLGVLAMILTILLFIGKVANFMVITWFWVFFPIGLYVVILILFYIFMFAIIIFGR